MASNELASSIQSLESQAEAIIAEARAQAAEILREANQGAARILAEKPSLDRVKGECTTIVERAREQARKAVDESTREAGLVRARAQRDSGKALQIIVRRIEGTVRGEP
jgi:vacuolar-type H+-ATPase subunit H